MTTYSSVLAPYGAQPAHTRILPSRCTRHLAGAPCHWRSCSCQRSVWAQCNEDDKEQRYLART